MKKTLLALAVAAAGTVMSADAATVYFQNTGNWETVSAYQFGPAEKNAWPGDVLTSTAVIGGVTYYYVDTTFEKVIFNNNNKDQQTKDLEATDGAVYSYAANSNQGNGTVYPIGTIKDGKFTAAGEVEVNYAKIYIPVSDWNKQACKIYSWEPYLFGGFPGSEMKKVSDGLDQPYWMIEIDENEISGPVKGWKVCVDQGMEESQNIENQTLFQNNYVYHLDGTSHPMGQHPESPVTQPGYTVSLVGDFTSPTWTAGLSGYVFTTEDKVNYTLNLDSFDTLKSFKITVQENGGKLGWYSGAEAMALNLGKAYTLAIYDNGNSNMKLAENATDVKFSFNVNTKELTVTGKKAGEIEVVTTYALYGTPFTPGENDWGAQPLTEKDGKWVVENLTVNSGAFGIQKLANNTQVDWIYSATTSHEVALNQEEACYVKVSENEAGHGNWNIQAGTYTFTFDPEGMTLTVSGENEENPDDPEIDYTKWYLNVQGGYNNYKPSGVQFNADGTAVSRNQAIGTTEFELKIWNGKEDAYYSCVGSVEPDKEYVLSILPGNHMTIAGAKEGQEFDVYFNAVTNVMKVVAVGGGDTEHEVSYALHGVIFDGNEWKDQAMTASADGTTHSWTGDVVAGEFGVKKYVDGTKTAWYSAESADSANISESGTYKGKVEGTNWKLSKPGNYSFVFDPEKEELTVTKNIQVGVDGIYAEDGEAIYLNLQGVRVMNPDKGIYIRVVNGKAVKVAL